MSKQRRSGGGAPVRATTMDLTGPLLLAGAVALGYWLLSTFLASRAAKRAAARPVVVEEVPPDAPWYVVLGVSQSASREQIVAAWRRQIRHCHPDKVATLDAETRRRAEARASRINAAYSRAPKRRA
ncbi:DnaJ domain-containing protein [Luteimonas sp. RD2P54]|uniref:DnaJ domain-containing protein n=1 Tax=Luteimonas endophytica TaxID=3042023 RepID=A0ABT6JAV4_9GAMM|nr:DnaJ domain-containing protein [Luteimonas endophytica]MDH5823960.1 DnaJ domain-containing protein [Luteimonas endophytica]